MQQAQKSEKYTHKFNTQKALTLSLLISFILEKKNPKKQQHVQPKEGLTPDLSVTSYSVYTEQCLIVWLRFHQQTDMGYSPKTSADLCRAMKHASSP